MHLIDPIDHFKLGEHYYRGDKWLPKNIGRAKYHFIKAAQKSFGCHPAHIMLQRTFRTTVLNFY